MTSMETRTNGRARRARWLAAAGALISAGAFAVTVTTASAHTAPIVADCDGVRVVLSDYDPAGANSVTVYVDGASTGTTTFGAGTSATHPFTDPTVSHTWRVVVSAWDDPTGANGWSFDTGTRTVGVCAEPTTPATSPTTTPVTAPPSTAGTVPGPVTPATDATVASVVLTAPAAGPTTTAVVAQAGPTVVVAPPSTTPVAVAGTLPVTGDEPWRAVGYALLAFGFGILLVMATRRPVTR